MAKAVSKNVFNEEQHPNWYRDIPVMHTLILGNFPPHSKKWHYPFYYPNSINNFWKILAAIAGVQLTTFKKQDATAALEQLAVEERYAIMNQLNVGVQNTAKRILRKNESANDTDIEILEFNDILSIIRKHTELKQILLPGFHAVHSTFRSFLKYMHQNKIEVEIEEVTPYPGFSFYFLVNGRKIKCVVLNSTSTATRIKLEVLIKQFEPYIVR